MDELVQWQVWLDPLLGEHRYYLSTPKVLYTVDTKTKTKHSLIFVEYIWMKSLS